MPKTPSSRRPPARRPPARRPPRIKICGVTSCRDAVLAADLGADFVGLNFYPPSPRYVSPRRAAEIAEAVRGRVQTVGVFVNRPRLEVEEIDAAVGLDLLQFHGDETPDDVRPFARRALVAVRVRDRVDAAALDALALAGLEGLWGVLIDVRHPRAYGGTGESWRFETLRDLDPDSRRRAFIAGGLRPDNVSAAIAAARPWGIDLCSGLEARPGRKDPELMKRLFEEVRHGESPAAA